MRVSFKTINDGQVSEIQQNSTIESHILDSAFSLEKNNFEREIQRYYSAGDKKTAANIENLQNMVSFIVPLYEILNRNFETKAYHVKTFKNIFEIAVSACKAEGLPEEYITQRLFSQMVISKAFKSISPEIEQFIISKTNFNAVDYTLTNSFCQRWSLATVAQMKDLELLEKLLPVVKLHEGGKILTNWNDDFEQNPLILQKKGGVNLRATEFDMIYAHSFYKPEKRLKKGDIEEFENFNHMYLSYAADKDKCAFLSREILLYALFLDMPSFLPDSYKTAKKMNQIRSFCKKNEYLKMTPSDEEAVLYMAAAMDIEELPLFSKWKFNAGKGKAFEALIKNACMNKNNAYNIHLNILIDQLEEAKKYTEKNNKDFLTLWTKDIDPYSFYARNFKRDQESDLIPFTNLLKENFELISKHFGKEETQEINRKNFNEKVLKFVSSEISTNRRSDSPERQKTLLDISFQVEEILKNQALPKLSKNRM